MAAVTDELDNGTRNALSRGTQETYRDSLKVIGTYFVTISGDPLVSAVKAHDIEAFLSWRRVHRLNGSAPLHNRTLQKDRAVLHRMFALADRHEYCDGNPVTRTEAPKADRRDPVLLSPEQLEGLLDACEDRPFLRLYILTLAETGMRCESEALHLQREDVDLSRPGSFAS